MKQLNPDHIKRYVCRLLPIPYVTKYKDSIHVTKCDDPERIASQFADFLRKNGRRTNPASQNIHFSSDKGMDFSPQIVKDIKWGKA